MKRCCYCRSDIPDAKSNDLQCAKCKKNEAKYQRKPTNCKYCQLPAAFFENKCVWCAHSERKIGPPVTCSECRLKAAFVRDPLKKDKPALCRLCRKSRNKSKETNLSEKSSESGKGSPIKRKNDFLDDQKSKVLKTALLDESGIEQIQSEQFFVIQQYKDQILDLKKKCSEKDKIILDRDKQVQFNHL
uniref:Stc1 domain-containing protein n=1 Tax=Syphacia muris TaxID=451379 RepID=A0A0N5AU85_9BILA